MSLRPLLTCSPSTLRAPVESPRALKVAMPVQCPWHSPPRSMSCNVQVAQLAAQKCCLVSICVENKLSHV